MHYFQFLFNLSIFLCNYRKVNILRKREQKYPEEMIAWLTGATSAGKTWLGDFLQHHHNFLHVDGDQRMILHYGNCEMTDGVVKAFYGYWFDNKEAPSELWHPYYNELCDKITDQYKADPEKSIVLSFSTYPRAVRDYVREEVKRRTGQDLIMVLLSMSLDDYARRQKDKFNEWAKAHNQTPEEVRDNNL